MDGRGGLEADFQQYYGLELDALLDSCQYRRAQVLAENLPAGSRTVTRMEPRAAWGTTEYLLAGILDALNFMRYENAGGKGHKPKPVERPQAKKRERKRAHVGNARTMELLFGKRNR